MRSQIILIITNKLLVCTGVLFLFFLNFFILGCSATPTSDLNIYFKKMEAESPKDQIEEFKALALDTAVLSSSLYPDIFIEASIVALHDTIIENNVKRYFAIHDIPLAGKEVKWTINAAFHNYLNNKDYDIVILLDSMISMSDRLYEENKHLHNTKN